MARLAFLSPIPPAPTGIADYSAEVLALLAPHHAIDVFHGQDAVDRLPASCGVAHVRTFRDRHRAQPYDLAIYQMGNGPAHAFLYEPLAAVPGLLVMHDLVLHHARARMFLESPEAQAYAQDPSSAERRRAAEARHQEYRAELAYSHPPHGARVAEVHLNTVGPLLPYAYPLFRLPVEASRATAVHNHWMAGEIAAEVPGARVAVLAMPVEPVPVAPGLRGAVRARLGFAADDFVVGCFGLLTPEKRIEAVARAVAHAAGGLPRLRLLLVGAVPDPPALERLLARTGVAARTVVTGRVAFEELAGCMEAADLVAQLRWPTARETSAAVLRVLAQGRPTVISDLGNLAEVPEDAVVRADPTDETGELARAILSLAARPAARQRLSERARAYVLRDHSPARCLETYQAAIEQARSAPPPLAQGWPAHWEAVRSR